MRFAKRIKSSAWEREERDLSSERSFRKQVARRDARVFAQTFLPRHAMWQKDTAGNRCLPCMLWRPLR